MAVRNDVSTQMRARLTTNRHGKLTGDQWKDMVSEPLAALLLLLAPAIIILGPRLYILALRALVVLAVVVVLVVLIPMLFRARRYARASLHFAQLYAGDNPMSGFLFWRPLALYNEKGDPLRFKKRLTRLPRLRPNHAYMVYYLREADHNVLLSLAPAEHPDADKWQPSEAFYTRQSRRR